MKMDSKINIKIESNLNMEIESNLNAELKMDGVLSLSNKKKTYGWSGGCQDIEVRIKIEKFLL